MSDGRIYVHASSGSGGGGRQTIGMASGQIGMAVRFHNNNGGSSAAENTMGTTDGLKISAISNEIVTATGITSGKIYSDYAFFTSVGHLDPILTSTGAVDYKAGTGVGHWPFK